MILTNRPIKPKSSLQKLNVLIRHVKNWHMLIIDKLWSDKNIIYFFKNNIMVECRPKSTDINESVVVLSGIEYPEQLCRLDKDDSIIVDVGANIGTFSLYVNHLNSDKKPRIYAIEASSDNLKLCQKNFQHNNMNHVILVEKAITDIDGMVNFDNSGNFDGFKVKIDAKNGIQVESQRLPTFCQSYDICHIDLLKMDIEGSEFDIFAKDGDFIKQKVDKLFMEYHLSNNHSSIDGIVNFLSDDFDIVLENTHGGGAC